MKRTLTLIQPLVIFLIVYSLTSCSSAKEDKYSLLSKNDKRSIDSFCICTEPIQPLMERIQNIKDSLSGISMLDSLSVFMKEFMFCIDKLKGIDSKNDKEEKDKQIIAYVKEKHPKCLGLLLGEEKTGKEGK